MPPSNSTRILDVAGASVRIFPDPPSVCRAAADHLVRVMRSAIEARAKAVLSLATGATPIPLYECLVARHRAGELSFADVTTYNLDEYYPISPADPQSYRAFMHEHLFRHVDLAPNRTHLLDGTVPEAFVAAHVQEYDRWIEADGGLDLQLLGIGRNGHIGFNEPSDLSVEEALALPTRLVELHPITRTHAARDFGGESNVIPHALTLGVAPILAARSILILALGAAKAAVVAQALRGPITAQMPASLLQTVPGKVTWMLDDAAARELGA
jgi:glucosamine-6-phosphate deaminase